MARRLVDDPEAFSQLYDLYCDRIYGYLLHRLSNPEDSADLTQRIFLKAFRVRSQYRPNRGSFATWIFAIARSQANSFSSTRKESQPLSTIPEVAMGASQGPDEAPLQVDEIDRLREFVGRLNPGDRELIVLRFDAGLQVPEIATVVGSSMEATKKRLQRTLKRLKDMYDDQPK